jgi:hypothetical protein
LRAVQTLYGKAGMTKPGFRWSTSRWQGRTAPQMPLEAV